MPQEKVSIIIPCYNEHLFLKKAVNSAFGQIWENKEIILVDDGSNLQTKKVINSLKPKIDLLITQKNKGVSAARNKGIDIATGDYILVLDSDDYFEPEFCKRAVPLLNDQNIKLVSCYSKWFDKKGSRIFKPRGGSIKDILLNNISMGSSLFRKIDWEIIEGYDEEMLKGYEDWEFNIRLLQDGGYAKIIPEVLFNYRNKAKSRNKNANLEKFEIQEYIFNKHSELYKMHFSAFLHGLLNNSRKNEAYRQKIKNSLEYKIGQKILKPFRAVEMLRKKISGKK